MEIFFLKVIYFEFGKSSILLCIKKMLTFSCDLILPNVLVTFRAFYVLVTDLETTLSIIDHKLTY